MRWLWLEPSSNTGKVILQVVIAVALYAAAAVGLPALREIGGKQDAPSSEPVVQTQGT